MIALVSSACSDDDGTTLDAGPVDGDGGSVEDAGLDVDAGEVLEPIEPTPPAPPDIPWLDEDADDLGLSVAPPAPPVLTPCPEGWREEPLSEAHPLVVCRPADGQDTLPAEECPPGEMRIPSEATCRRPGRACPSGTFPDDLPEETIYVDGRLAAAGSGRLDDPFSDLQDAIDAAADDATIALSAALYRGPFVVERPLTIRGACAGFSRIISSSEEAIRSATRLIVEDVRIDAPMFAIVSPDLTLRGVEIFGGGITSGARSVVLQEVLHLGPGLDSVRDPEELIVRRSRLRALRAARVEVEDSGVFRTLGAAVEAGTGVIRRSVLEGSPAVQANEDVDVEDSVLVGQQSGFRGSGELRRVRIVSGDRSVVPDAVVASDVVLVSGGHTLSIEDDEARVEVERAFIEATSLAFASVFVSRPGSLTMQDVELVGGNGPVYAPMGGELSLTRARIRDGLVAAVLVIDGSLSLQDVEVQRIRRLSADAFAAAIHIIGEDATAHYEDVWIHDCDDLGFLSFQGTVRAERLAVTEVRGVTTNDETGAAFRSFGGGSATLDQLAVRGVDDVGVDNPDVPLTARNLWITDLRSTLSRAAAVEVEGRMDLRGLYARDFGGIGIRVDADLTLRDARIEDVRAGEAFGLPLAGNGMALFGGDVDAARVSLERTTEVGVAVFDGVHRFEDLLVRETAERPCGDLCEGFELGVGVGVYGGELEVERFAIDANDLAGIQVVNRPACFSQGFVRDNPIGVNAQGEVDLAKLMQGVRYDNEQNLASRDITPPMP